MRKMKGGSKEVLRLSSSDNYEHEEHSLLGAIKYYAHDLMLNVGLEIAFKHRTD